MPIGGKNTTWQHGTAGAASSLTDFTTKMRNVTMSLNGEEVDATVFGDGFRQYEQSFKNGTFETEYKYETGSTLYSQLGAIFTNTAEEAFDFEYGPNGDASGEAKVTGSMIMTSLGTPTNVGDLIVIPVSWRITGAVEFDDFT